MGSCHVSSDSAGHVAHNRTAISPIDVQALGEIAGRVVRETGALEVTLIGNLLNVDNSIAASHRCRALLHMPGHLKQPESVAFMIFANSSPLRNAPIRPAMVPDFIRRTSRDEMDAHDDFHLGLRRPRARGIEPMSASVPEGRLLGHAQSPSARDISLASWRRPRVMRPSSAPSSMPRRWAASRCE